MNEWIQVLTGALGSFGFGILFNLRGRKLTIITLGGLISWSVFLLLERWIPGESARYFLSMVVISVCAEIFARVEKTPTTTFLVPCVIPLIPGSALYYTMNYALKEQWDLFLQKAFYTLELALSLALGIIAVTTATRLLTLLHHRKRQKEKHFHHSI
jgi:uncharacterized membrane protein YjjB (DUF3815 family)